MLKLLTRIGVLAGILFALQVSLYALLPSRGVPSPVLRCEQYLEEGRDVIYFGDSTLYRDDPEATEGRTLPEWVELGLEGTSLGTIAHDAYDPELYHSFVRFIADRQRRPKVVIIPIHLRSFSIERDRRPEYQFVREHYFLRHDSLVARAFFKPFAALRVVNLTPISKDAHLRMEVYDDGKLLGVVGDLLPQPEEALQGEVLEDFIRLCYFYRLTPEHRQLVALRELLEICVASDMTPVVYITPINLDLGDDLLGAEFATRIEENSAVIEALLGEFDMRLLDYSGEFTRQDFVSGSFPDSYLNQRGKRRLSERLIDVLADALE